MTMKTIFFGYDQQGPPDARKNYLELAGYRVRSFASSADLLAAFKKKVPDAVVMDVLMEGRNGFEIAETLNREYAPRSFPMIVCTRFYRTRGFREHARQCGVDEYLLTPISLQDFLAAVNEAIKNYQAQSEVDEAA